jgi:oligopeptide transport system substrate-binding protein
MKRDYWASKLGVMALALLALAAVAVAGCRGEETVAPTATAPPAVAPPAAATATAVPATSPPAAEGNIVNVFGRRLPADAAPLAQQYLILPYRQEGESLEFAVTVYNPGGGSFQGGQSLAMIDKNGKMHPGSADSWEVSSNGLDWTFRINKDLKWSDGTPVTADDFVYTWRYYADPKHAYDFAWYFGSLGVKNWEAVNKGQKPLDQLGVEAVDAKTLVFHLDAPAPFAPGFMMYGSPLAKHQAEKHGPRYNDKPETAVSMTPWILQEWVPNQHARFKANVNYNGRYKPYVEKIRNVFAERDFDAFLADEVDWVNGPFAPADQERLVKDPKLFAQRGVSQGDFRTDYLFFDYQSAPFNNVKVRQAFAHAIDRDAIIKNIIGDSAAMAAYGMLMPGFPDWVDPNDLKQYQGYDPALAKKLLSEAGYPDGKNFPKLELALREELETFQSVGAAIAQQLKEVLNIDVTVSNKDRKTYMDALNSHKLQFALVSYGFDYLDASNMLSVFKTNGRHNWNNAEWEKLRVEATSNLDSVKRSEQMKQLQRVLSQDVGAVFLDHRLQNEVIKPYWKGTSLAANTAGFAGIQFPYFNAGFTIENLYEIYIASNVKDYPRRPAY